MRTVNLRLPSGRALRIVGSRAFHLLKVLESGGINNYEPESIACALACVQVRHGAFYDVGANIGIFAVTIASELDRKSYAFEPTPELADVIAKQIADYNLPIELCRVAISDRAGSADFFLSPRSDASNSLNGGFREGSKPISVVVQTIDTVLTEAPCLIKIDVETFEPEVLAGATETIAEHRPFIIAEVIRPFIARRINAFFEGRGYSIYHITSAAEWTEVQTLPEDVSGAGDRNWLFAPAPLDAAFAEKVAAWREKIRACTG